MRFEPASGVDGVRIGDRRCDVEGRMGPPAHPQLSGPRAVYPRNLSIVVTYTEADRVEIVELAPHSADTDQVFFGDVQLTYRFMDEVVADLRSEGLQCIQDDIGFVFEEGFAVFSMSSVSAWEIDPSACRDDERDVVEGVSIAPYEYFVRTP